MGLNPNDLPELFRAKLLPNAQAPLPPPPPSLALSERDHQSRFARELKARSIPFVWHSTAKPSTASLGTPDFIVAFSGLTFWIEFKLLGQSLSTPQSAFKKLLNQNGVTLHLVHSAEDALNLLLPLSPKK